MEWFYPQINDTEQSGFFDRSTVMKQVRALQILETVNLMAGGLPHRMRFKAFNLRYRLLVPMKLLKRDEENMTDDCQVRLLKIVFLYSGSKWHICCSSFYHTLKNGDPP